MMWNDFIKGFDEIYHNNGWMMQVFIIVLITLFLHAISAFIVRRLIVKTKTTRNYFDETLLASLNKPLGFLIWLVGITLAAEVAGSLENSPAVFGYVPGLRTLGVLLIVTWFCSRFIKNLETNYLTHASKHNKSVDKTLIHAVSQLVTISIIITSVLIGMQLFGVPISGLLAFGGIGGAGIAFASKDLLANFFG